MLKNEKRSESWLQNVKMRFSILLSISLPKTHNQSVQKALQDVFNPVVRPFETDMAALEKQAY